MKRTSLSSAMLFSAIWHIDAVLILIFGALGLIGIAFVLLGVESRERPAERLTHVGDVDLATDKLSLSEFDEIPGTDYLYARLAPPAEYSFKGSSGPRGRDAARNALFFDAVAKKAHWLLGGNEQRLTSFLLVAAAPQPWSPYQPGEATRPRRTLAILVEIEEAPHASLERGDARTRSLAVASPGGRDLVKIASSIDGLLGHHLVDDGSLLVFYVSAGTARVLDLDPVSRTVRSDGLLSPEG